MKKKVYGIIGLLLVLAAVYLVGSVSRSISDFHDNKETLIRNSNGNYWEPVGANIQIAIDDLGNGGTVWLPPGTYVLTAYKTYLKSNIRLVGSGVGITVIKLGDGTAGYPLWAEFIENFTVSDLTVDGNRHNGCDGNGMVIRDCSNFIIENVHMTRAAASGLSVQRSQNGFISNYKADDTERWHGLTVGTSDGITVSDCIMWNTNGYGIDFSGVHDCTVNNILVYDSKMGIKVDDDEDARYTENSVFNNINLINLDSAGDGLKIQMNKNTNYNNIFVSGGWNGIKIWETCTDVSLSNFYVEGTIGQGLVLSGKNLNVNNGIVENTVAYGLCINSAENVTVSNVQIHSPNNDNPIINSNNVVISDCSITNGAIHGLSIKSSSDVIISGCRIQDNTADGITFWNEGMPCENLVLTDNIITGNGGRGIDIMALPSGTHDNFIVTNNNLLYNSGKDFNDDSSASNSIVTKNLVE
ncbi:right-handed parallel beta-helix repeat-containing protein [archaeon]|nr:right-handed parallel beta-helix repeat-containing protein [archaeon]